MVWTTTCLLLLLASVVCPSQLCPCDTSPDTCDRDCCCDLACSADDISSFTCRPFTLSQPLMCCQDELRLAAQSYGTVRTCTNDVICLQETASLFSQFPNTTSSSSSSSAALGAAATLNQDVAVEETDTQYHDSNVLLEYDVTSAAVNAFIFPAQFHGDVCAPSPVRFYSDVHSTCRARRDVGQLCAPGSVLDYKFYLDKRLLTHPSSPDTLNLLTNITFSCLTSGLLEPCFLDTSPPDVTSDGSVCLHAVSSVALRLTTREDNMTIAESAVTVTLSAISLTETHVNQTFSLTYLPASQTDQRSGNFGYLPGSHILSGVLSGDEVTMNSDPAARVLALFSSSDCEVFEAANIRFGLAFYTGCKLVLPFYNFERMGGQDSREEYCNVLRNVTASVMYNSAATVVGTTGMSSVGDASQWVHVLQEPSRPSDAVSDTGVKCDDVITHRAYKIFYTEVGEVGNLQAVITTVKVEHSQQHVVLHCGGSYCSSSKQQHILLSNSVQFVYNEPATQARYKVKPTTAIILPLDFFYPLTSRALLARTSWLLVALSYSWAW